jgi:hypothetical protein
LVSSSSIFMFASAVLSSHAFTHAIARSFAAAFVLA